MTEDDDFLSDSESISNTSASLSNVSEKKESKPNKGNRSSKKQEVCMSELLSGTAESIQRLVSVVANKKEANTEQNDPSDDDWLYCKRFYNKLRKLPEGEDKDFLKVKLETDVLKFSYRKRPLEYCQPNAMVNTQCYPTEGYFPQQPLERHVPQPSSGSFTTMLTGFNYDEEPTCSDWLPRGN